MDVYRWFIDAKIYVLPLNIAAVVKQRVLLHFSLDCVSVHFYSHGAAWVRGFPSGQACRMEPLQEHDCVLFQVPSMPWLCPCGAAKMTPWEQMQSLVWGDGVGGDKPSSLQGGLFSLHWDFML